VRRLFPTFGHIFEDYKAPKVGAKKINHRFEGHGRFKIPPHPTPCSLPCSHTQYTNRTHVKAIHTRYPEADASSKSAGPAWKCYRKAVSIGGAALVSLLLLLHPPPPPPPPPRAAAAHLHNSGLWPTSSNKHMRAARHSELRLYPFLQAKGWSGFRAKAALRAAPFFQFFASSYW
jgi:hypothetical protein